MREMQIIETARKNLLTALTDPQVKNLPDAGWRWQTYCIQIRKHIGQFNTLQEVIHFAQESDGNAGYEARMVGQQLADYASDMEQNYLNKFPDFKSFFSTFQDHILSIPETLTHFNGRLVSSALYNHILHTMRCLNYARPERVLEIGGGYGAPGRVWMINGIHSPKQYIDVDFPESLFFAECYFRATLPEYEVVYLYDKKDFKKLKSHSSKAIFLCPIASFKNLLEYDIDLITNTGSLQEMSQEYVSFYMQMISESKCKMFYSCNFFAQPLNQLMESMNLGAPILDRKWKAIFKEYGHDNNNIRSTAEFLFVRSSINKNIVRKGLELLFSRSSRFDDVRDIKTQIDSCLQQGMPRNGEDFLELFDMIRQINDSNYIMKVVNATIERMSYIPKETLLLARRAKLPKVDIVKKLEQIASHSSNTMGGVGALVSHIRNRLIKEGPDAQFLFLVGQLINHEKGTIIEINKVIKKVRNNICGSIERIHQEQKGIIVSGWAMDGSSNEAASIVHVFYADILMWSGRPFIERAEFGKASLVGFEFGVFLNPPINLNQILVLAEFMDGTVGLLANGGSIKIFGSVA